MQYRPLGSSGLEISAVGFGGWAIGGWMWGGADQAQAIAALEAAIDQGINLIDTAPVYGFGQSEELVGRAIKGRRDRVILATKCGLIWDRDEGEFFFHADQQGATPRASEKKIYKNLRPDSIRREIDESLRRLKTDHVDLYQTHWQDSTTPIDDTVAVLLDLKQQGKIRAIGASNASLDQLKQYRGLDADQEKYSLLDRNLETDGRLDYCREHHVAVLAYSPLANGLLTGKITPDRQYGPGDLRRSSLRFRGENVAKVNAALERLRPLAQEHHASLAQLVIAWTFLQPGMTCVLCGARDAAQAAENAGAGKIVLRPDEVELIGGVFGRPAS